MSLFTLPLQSTRRRERTGLLCQPGPADALSVIQPSPHTDGMTEPARTIRVQRLIPSGEFEAVALEALGEFSRMAV
jgi:hypothetical protein